MFPQTLRGAGRVKPPPGVRLDLDLRPSLAAGLAGAWAFTEGGGKTARDLTGLGHDLALGSSATWGPQQPPLGVSLKGDNSSTGGASAANFSLPAAEWALAAWVVPNVVDSNIHSVCRLSGAGTQAALYLWNTNKWAVYTTAVDTQGSVTAVAGQVYHLVGLNSASQNRRELWVNGVQVAGNTGVSTPPGTGPLNALTDGFGNNNNAWLGFLAIYGRALAGDEIRALYREPLGLVRTRPAQGQGVATVQAATAHLLALLGVGA